jgi:hypothetical protein
MSTKLKYETLQKRSVLQTAFTQEAAEGDKINFLVNNTMKTE